MPLNCGPSGMSDSRFIPSCLTKVLPRASAFKEFVEMRERCPRWNRALAQWCIRGARKSSLPSEQRSHTVVIQFRTLGSTPRVFFEPRAGPMGRQGVYRVANEYLVQVGALTRPRDHMENPQPHESALQNLMDLGLLTLGRHQTE